MATPPPPVVELRDVVRRFGPVTAVDGLSLRVGRGELFGLVGPDGAGKTTTLRLLIGALRADAGSITVAGEPVPERLDRVRPLVGYVAQRFALYGDLTVDENLAFSAELYGVPRATANARADELLSMTNLLTARTRLAQHLSGGMRQKLALANALIHQPELLILDEPTNGVDPVARREFWRLLTGLRRRNVTVLVSTAYLDEAELCTRIGFLHAGRLVVEGPPAAVRADARERILDLAATPRNLAVAILNALEGVRDVRIMGGRLRLALADGASPAAVGQAAAAALTTAGVAFEPPREVAVTLEDIVLRLAVAGRDGATP